MGAAVRAFQHALCKDRLAVLAFRRRVEPDCEVLLGTLSATMDSEQKESIIPSSPFPWDLVENGLLLLRSIRRLGIYVSYRHARNCLNNKSGTIANLIPFLGTHVLAKVTLPVDLLTGE